MVVTQGDVFWVDMGDPVGSGPAYRHPHVVIQNNLFNRSNIGTVVVCAVTSNLKRASAPGNVLLDRREANLSRRSVVNVSQIFTVDRAQLGKKIGAVSPGRIREILDGVGQRLVVRDWFHYRRIVS